MYFWRHASTNIKKIYIQIINEEREKPQNDAFKQKNDFLFIFRSDKWTDEVFLG